MKRTLVACLAAALLLSWSGPTAAAETELAVVASGSYLAPEDESSDVALTFSDFEAKMAALRKAMARFAENRSIAFDHGEQPEILILAAQQTDAEYLKRDCRPVDDGLLCQSMVRCRVAPGDFVRAELLDYRLDSQADFADFTREMDPVLTGPPDPAAHLARAYREISRGRLRPAYIYLQRLLERHPNWTSAMYALAQTSAQLNEEKLAADLYARACRLGDARSCAAMADEE